MRKLFGELVADAIQQDQNLWFLTGDLGFGVLDPIRQAGGTRFRNVGAAEQLMLGAAVGLSHCNKTAIAYSITPFVIYIPYEYLRNYLNHEGANVKLVGAGRNQDYGHLGFSHWADDDESALSVFENIETWWPKSESELEKGFQDWLYHKGPAYLNLTR